MVCCRFSSTKSLFKIIVVFIYFLDIVNLDVIVTTTCCQGVVSATTPTVATTTRSDSDVEHQQGDPTMPARYLLVRTPTMGGFGDNFRRYFNSHLWLSRLLRRILVLSPFDVHDAKTKANYRKSYGHLLPSEDVLPYVTW